MAKQFYVIVGRSRDCDIVISDSSVSARHARLAWKGMQIEIEDLGSANGTYVHSKRVERVKVRPGDSVRFGSCALSWSDPKLKPFLRQGASGTVLGAQSHGTRVGAGEQRFICGSCGKRGLVPAGSPASVRCHYCGAELNLSGKKRASWAWVPAALFVFAAAGALAWFFTDEDSRQRIEQAARDIRENADQSRPEEERSIRRYASGRIVEALDSENSVTRNYAVRLAAEAEGPFSLEQVALIWSHVRDQWRYVNDPEGREYFARASETIENEFVGDCDDFAIVVSSLIAAIGGKTRMVMMDSAAGGHAYAEVCLPLPPIDAARRLSAHYRSQRSRYLGSTDKIHFRASSECGLWLNLDWNAGVPGGSYGQETWAVAIYPDGETESLVPYQGEAPVSLVPETPANSAPTEGAAMQPRLQD